MSPRDKLVAHLGKFGYKEPFKADPIEVLEAASLGGAELDRLFQHEREKLTPGTSAAITPDAQADKLEQRVELIKQAAELCAQDADWLALFEHYFDEALSGG